MAALSPHPAIPQRRRFVPDPIRLMGLIGQPHRLAIGPWANLEHVGIAVVVVGDHVEYVQPADSRLREIALAAIGQTNLQVSFDQPLAKMPGAKTISRKFLAREMHEPDVAGEL